MIDLNPRLYLLQRLRQELLGPRGGPEERISLSTDPREEYTTGVLDVEDDDDSDELALEALEAGELSLSGAPNEEDDEEHHPLRQAADFAPKVDPRRMPRSIGLSFLVSGSGVGKVCVSGGRYSKTEEGWRRHSYAITVPAVCFEKSRHEFHEEAFGVRMVVLVKEAGPGKRAVSVFVTNKGRWEHRTEQRVSTLLYQPQIRVCLSSGTELLNIHEGRGQTPASAETCLQLLYRNNPVKGRGHMCSAVWQECDLEQLHGSPFQWPDAKEGLDEFATCDLRTEFMPAVAVATPSLQWRGGIWSRTRARRLGPVGTVGR